MKHGSDQKCPACQHPAKLTADDDDTTTEAKEGDLAICEKCSEISYFQLEGENLKFVRGTTELFDKLPVIVQLEVSRAQLQLMWNLRQ